MLLNVEKIVYDYISLCLQIFKILDQIASNSKSDDKLSCLKTRNWRCWFTTKKETHSAGVTLLARRIGRVSGSFYRLIVVGEWVVPNVFCPCSPQILPNLLSYPSRFCHSLSYFLVWLSSIAYRTRPFFFICKLNLDQEMLWLSAWFLYM